MHLPTNDDDLLKFFLYHYDKMNDYLSGERESWLSYYKEYRNYVDEKTYPFKNQVFLPLTFSHIETIIPREMSLLYKRPLVDVLPLHPSVIPEAVRKGGLLLNKSWMVDRETWFSLFLILKEKSFCGTAGGKLVWSSKRRNMPEFTMVNAYGEDIVAKKKMVSKLIENRPRLIHRDMYDITPDLLNGRDPEFVFDTVIKPLDELLYGPIEYDNHQDIKDMEDFNTGLYDDYRNYRLSSIEKSYPERTDIDNHPRQVIEGVFRQYTKDGEEIRLISVINRKKICRKTKLNVWPWYFCRNYPMQHEFLGISEMEAIERLQHSANNHTNMMLDNLLLSMYKMLKVGDGAGVDMDQLVIEPAGVIQAADISQIEEMRFSDLPRGAFEFGQFFPQMMQLATGAHDYLQGITPQRKEFATSILTIQQAGEARFDTKIKIDERDLIAPVAKGMLELAQYELDEPQYIDVSERNSKVPIWEKIAMQHIQGPMDVEIAASAMGMGAMERQQLTEFISDSAQLLGPETPIEARLELMELVAVTFGNEAIMKVMDNVKRIVGASRAQAASLQQIAPGQAGPPPTNGGTSMAGIAGIMPPSQGGSNQSAPPPR